MHTAKAQIFSEHNDQFSVSRRLSVCAVMLLQRPK
jgi:hypothetical protein